MREESVSMSRMVTVNQVRQADSDLMCDELAHILSRLEQATGAPVPGEASITINVIFMREVPMVRE